MTSRIQFDQRLQRFRETNEAIANWIDAIPKEKWAIAYDKQGRRYGHMTTNLSEAVNKVLRGARNLPITSLVKCTYTRCVEYFVKREEQALAELTAGHRYCQKLLTQLQQNQREACTLQVTRFDVTSQRFEVEEIGNALTRRRPTAYSVNLQTRYCQCGKFRAYRYPCSHVIAACTHVSIDLYQFVDPAYLIRNVAEAYGGQWFPIGNEECIPPLHGYPLLPDRAMVRQKGRPKSTRIRNEMDLPERQVKCGICRQVGHSRRTCPNRQRDNN